MDIHDPKPYEFIGKSMSRNPMNSSGNGHPVPQTPINLSKTAIHGPKPYEFIRQMDIHGPEPYEYVGKWISNPPNPVNS